MLNLIRLAVVAALLCFTPTLAQAQVNALPPVDAQGDPGPLTPAQLTSDERARYDALPAGSAQARQFLYTRGFLRFCRLVVEGNMAPADLPALPSQENWNRQFLTPEEGANIVDVALGRQIAAHIDPSATLPQARPPTDTLPAVDADGMIAPLAVAQLDSAERATYATLAGDDARRFLYTRGFLRFCRLVVANQLPPLQLPELPVEDNWDRRFISEEDGHSILDVALGMQMMAMMRPPQ